MAKQSLQLQLQSVLPMKEHYEMTGRRLPALRRALLAWYDQHGRDLPWRSTRDPYRTWVSEIMLQQTRVAAVLPRYEDFLRRFPSVERLASSTVDSVLAEWSGLGYYRRARNLHAAARVIVRERRGRFPETVEGWRDLPGIGRYTAAAISSIALNQPVAVLDGNVKRVVRRLLGNGNASGESWGAVERLLDRERPGDFNQAMMELGATTCLPGEPLCAECPISQFCQTRGRGKPGVAKPRQRKVRAALALARQGDSVLLIRRAASARLMPGMWELPAARHSFHPRDVLFTLRHSITITNYTIAVIAQTRPDRGGAEWIRISRVNRLPLTGLARKILRQAKIIE
jgi:A/G-specific adenine glycosylase